MSDPTASDVQRFIAQGLACEHLEVEGDGRHFFATIVSTEFEGVSRVFPMPAGAVTALRNVSRQVDRGDYVAITGPSGCGKSTLLHLIGCVDSPSSGSISFENRDVAALTESERSRIRLTRIGFVFQRFFLLPMLTAAENIELPQAEAGVPATERRQRT